MAPVLASYVFFVHVDDSDPANALKSVQWVYLAIACFVFVLAVVFFLYDQLDTYNARNCC